MKLQKLFLLESLYRIKVQTVTVQRQINKLASVYAFVLLPDDKLCVIILSNWLRNHKPLASSLLSRLITGREWGWRKRIHGKIWRTEA